MFNFDTNFVKFPHEVRSFPQVLNSYTSSNFLTSLTTTGCTGWGGGVKSKDLSRTAYTHGTRGQYKTYSTSTPSPPISCKWRRCCFSASVRLTTR